MDDLLNFKGFKIIFWNVRSILNKMDSIITKLSENNVAVLVITESWLKPDIPDAMICIEGYTHYRYDRQFVNDQGYLKRGGGIIIYLKNSRLFDHVHGDLFNVSTNDIEQEQFVSSAHTLGVCTFALYTVPPMEMSKNVFILLIIV